jgi:hypothetical protein
VQDWRVKSMHRHPRYLLAIGIAAVLVGGCSKSTSTDSTPTKTATESANQHFVDTVNGLCDKLEPEVIRVTQGGSIDIPASQYLKDWPAHQQLLADFDKSLAKVSLPPAATSAADALGNYVKYADTLDAARLKAAKQGEEAWRLEVAAEKNVATDPAIADLTDAGFADSCQAR